jgi:uncharacterized protein YvpB
MIIDICPSREKYYVQTNNEDDPNNECQVTSMTAGLDIGKFGFEPVLNIVCNYKQPENKLKYYIRTNPTVQNYWRRYFNIEIPAEQWAGVMVFAVNNLYKKDIVYFDDYLDINDIVNDLQKGLPIYTSMKYLENKNTAGKLSPVDGHIVLIVGVDGDNLLINDPYKNHLTGGADGFKNIYTPEDFAKHNKGYAIRYKKA